MTTILVPYHQDARLDGDLFPLPAGPVVTIDPDLPGGALWPRLAALHEATAAAVADGISAAGTATVISGDCLLAVPSIAGAQRAGVDPSLVWFDAHGDAHTLQTTTSGYLGGLSLRLAQGVHPELLSGPLGLRPVAEDRTVLVGARDLDPAEVDFLAKSPVRRTGVAELTADALPDGPLVLHVDVDVVDAGDLPGLLFPVHQGPSVEAVLAACGRVIDTGRVIALDVACPWHPSTTKEEQRIRTDLLAALLDLTRR